MYRIRDIAALVSLITVAIAMVTAPATASAAVTPNPNVAALQAALKHMELYTGQVDGIRGPLTKRGVKGFQKRNNLRPDGVAGPRTRKAMGWRGRPMLGMRNMRFGVRGWDVAALQFMLQNSGFGAGRADGIFGRLTRQAVVRAQKAEGAKTTGVVRPRTIKQLRAEIKTKPTRPRTVTVDNPIPVGDAAFIHAVPGPIGDGFGARRAGGRIHQGVDYPVPHGTRISASRAGTTIFAGNNRDGYGNLVVVQHADGYTTWYAHMSKITSWVGEVVKAGTRVGLVGSTGYSTGPHLHFEIRRYNTPLNPMRFLPSLAGLASVSAGGGSHGHHGADGHDHAHDHGDFCDRPGAQRRAKPVKPTANWIATEPFCATASR